MNGYGVGDLVARVDARSRDAKIDELCAEYEEQLYGRRPTLATGGARHESLR